MGFEGKVFAGLCDLMVRYHSHSICSRSIPAVSSTDVSFVHDRELPIVLIKIQHPIRFWFWFNITEV